MVLAVSIVRVCLLRCLLQQARLAARGSEVQAARSTLERQARVLLTDMVERLAEAEAAKLAVLEQEKSEVGPALMRACGDATLLDRAS